MGDIWMGRRATLRAVRLTRTIGVVAAIVGAGCGGGDSSTGPSKPNVVGTYTLQQIGGAAMPVEIFNGSATDDLTGIWYAEFVVTVKGGTLELTPDGRYRTSFDYTLLHDGVREDRTLVAEGTYEVAGDRLTLLRDNGVDGSDGSVADGSVTVELTLMRNDPTKPFRFRK